jgi:hypothetical protein
MNWKTYNELYTNGTLLFNCILTVFKKDNFFVTGFHVGNELGINKTQALELLEVLTDLKIISKDEVDIDYVLNYSDLPSLLNSHPNLEFVDYLEEQLQKFRRAYLFYMNEFQIQSDIVNDEPSEAAEIEENKSSDYLVKLQELKEEAEKELDEIKKSENLNREKELSEKNGILADRHVFTSSRLAGQDVFTEKIVITDTMILWSKRQVLSKKEISFQLKKISSVTISSGVLYVDIEIKSNNGKIVGTNFTKGDAKKIKRLIQEGME